MLEHLDLNQLEHMILMKNFYDSQLKLIKSDYEKIIKTQEIKIQQLERNQKDYHTKVVWKFKNFSVQKKKHYVQSEKFTIETFTWFLGIFCDGDNEDSKGFISLYLFLDMNNILNGKSVNLEYSLKLVNHIDPLESVKKEFATTFPIKGGQGWGDRKAIKSSKITEEAGFLQKDTLYLEAEIIVKKVLWVV